MKSYGYLLLLLFILPNIDVVWGSFSIDEILNYLQETGYYDLLQAIKIEFGNDVAIDVCEALIQSSDCKTIITIYMTDKYRLLEEIEKFGNAFIENPIIYRLKLEKEKIIINGKVWPVVDLILFQFYDVLKRNMDKQPKKMDDFFRRINRLKI